MVVNGLLISLSLIVGTSTANAAEYLVKYKEGAGYQMQSLMSAEDATDFSETASIVKLTVDEKSEAARLLEVMNDPGVEYVVPNTTLEAFTLPLTPNVRLRDQWALGKVRAREAWNKLGALGSKKIVVAVIDTGVDSEHESLKPNMVPGYNPRTGGTDTEDVVSRTNPGHGTHCAGVIGATGLAEGGVIGISPQVALMPMRMLDASGRGDLMGAIKAIDYAVSKNVDVISASWGAKVMMVNARPLLDAVKRADDAGVIFVAAAGNDNLDADRTDVYPANTQYWNTITVGATDANDQRPKWSNFGRNKVHLAAPGDGIMSTVPKNGYKALSGTSMATPMVAGLVALMKSNDSNLTGAQAKAILQSTGVKVNMNTACNCRVDAAAAVAAVQQRKQTIVPAAVTLQPGQSFKAYVLYGRGNETFSSSNPNVLRVDADGTVTAVSDGSAMVNAVDYRGETHRSLNYYVVSRGGSSTPGEPGKCPHANRTLCQVGCLINPSNPWCAGQ